MNKGTHLISNYGYIDSVRYLGLTTVDAINELIDNSFDADAKRIHIHILEDFNGISIAIEDDGKGIEADKIDKVLAFGGRLVSPSNKITTGRFGWGLSAAACCQAPRTEIYSKINQKWFYSYIDLEQMKKLAEPIIPEAAEALPPTVIPLKLKTRTGTVVYLKNCDNLDYKTKKALADHLIDNIGEIHRYQLRAGKKIYVNDKRVEINDPLMLMPDCRDIATFGQASEFEEIVPIIIEDEIDPITNKPAEINIKIALMNLEQIRKNKDWNKLVRQKGFNVDNQGFYLVRHNRQIGRALTLNLFQRHNYYNYFRGEISFPPELDKYFGVQTNKSRFSINPVIREKIGERVKNVLSQILTTTKNFTRETQARESDEGVRPSEEIAAKAETMLKRNTYEPSVKELQKEAKQIEIQKQEEINKVVADSNLTDEEKQEKIAKIEKKFQFQAPFKRVLKHIRHGPFYFPEPQGKSTELVINTDHQFYTKIYEQAIESQLDVYLDLLLFTLAKAELLYYDREDIRKFYDRQRIEWSAILTTYLDESYNDDD